MIIGRHTIIGGIVTNDQVRDIRSSGYAPTDGRESAIIADLLPGNYTGIVRGKNIVTGSRSGRSVRFGLVSARNSLLGYFPRRKRTIRCRVETILRSP